ncbi:INO80 complex subunit C [Rhinolophus ferrumequinum]|uniref:INO80 complex subunit C n=1 Tax=Rhinolophus ferrumequinum TaxID=59479 RepID=A0A7J7TQV4_RHIFE|nr:INO80 complex subunit C [Rhinolophus ferrumequinum]
MPPGTVMPTAGPLFLPPCPSSWQMHLPRGPSSLLAELPDLPTQKDLGISMEAMSENKMVPSDFSTGPMEKTAKPLPFKDLNFVHSGHGGAVAGKKNRTWKNLKQILASERALPWQLNDPNYFSIDAPPSFKPAKKYSDVSGLLANYTDPQSKLRFSTIEEFSYIRRLPSDVVTGYLALRKATSIVP